MLHFPLPECSVWFNRAIGARAPNRAWGETYCKLWGVSAFLGKNPISGRGPKSLFGANPHQFGVIRLEQYPRRPYMAIMLTIPNYSGNAIQSKLGSSH